jgi:hypothetical protein
MITCNKCGYDKAVQGLNEIWCDKCDGVLKEEAAKPRAEYLVDEHIKYVKEMDSLYNAYYFNGARPFDRVEDANAETPIKYVDDPQYTSEHVPPDWQLAPVCFSRASSTTYYVSNALPAQPFEDTVGDNQYSEYIHLRAGESPWDHADAYRDKHELCLYVRTFFGEEVPGYQIYLTHGVGCDMWRAVIAEAGVYPDIVAYAHKNLETLCDILEYAFCSWPDTPDKSIMDVVRTAVEDYFEEA